jgi:molybdopterin-containing oxidoreductase family iron-sulfur binding subunit
MTRPRTSRPAADAQPTAEPAAEPKLWRSLDELAETPEFEEWLHRELPRHAAEWDDRFDRRKFLTLSGAAVGLAGLTACTKQPLEKIVPYVRQPEELVPGKPLFFATAMPFAGYAQGLLAESHMGRPTKLEGNPEHPASLGASDLFAQASVLDLYDPDRSRSVTHLGKIRTWEAFLNDLATTVGALQGVGGRGLRILTGTVTSPTLGALLEELLETMPEARWHRWEPAGRDAAHRGVAAAFGEPLEVRYDFTRADVVVAIDADFLHRGPAAVRHAKDFAARRSVVRDPAQAAEMSRLYSIESTPTGTSTVADHRLPLRPTEVGHFVVALAAELGVGGATTPAGFGDGERAAWVEEVAEDLRRHQGRSVVIAGDELDPEIHTLVHAINDDMGNGGHTVLYTDPVEVTAEGQDGTLAELADDLRAGDVDTLVILGSNPVHTAPADLDFAKAVVKARLAVHLGSHLDETSDYCHWHLPEAHYLESWGDARAFDGTVSVGQPLIEPLYGGKTAIEVVAALLGRGGTPADELIREHHQRAWEARGEGGTFERFWRRCLHDGHVAGTALEPRTMTLQPEAVASAASAVGGWAAAELELLFRPDPTIFDGRYANNPWLQECPKPITKLTWDNALLVSPRTARDLGFGDLLAGGGQDQRSPMARLAVGERSLEVPVWAVPGQADGTLLLHLGYGRTRGGEAAVGAGFDANRLRTADAPFRVSEGVSVTPAGGRHTLASTQDHHSMEGRHLVRRTDLEHYLEDPEHAGMWEHHGDVDVSLMPEWEYDGYAWGMAIDLTACTGCNACLMACQSENNIPSVGKDQVVRGREMHWIRVDRYFAGDGADAVTEVVNQPVTCMHCEQAPCEVVCPVAATVHSDEGLNDMVYNRCVGTRYCSNNCPYKVRRFNFLLYQDFETPSLQLGRNPDVTVRSRGVMEKCTYCVQRINKARVEAKRERRKIRDGEVVTACQQACPSGAIVFGDQNDPDSRVSAAKASPLDYRLLEELGTRPRTTYLGRVRNPNPALVERLGHGAPAGDDGHGDGHHA